MIKRLFFKHFKEFILIGKSAIESSDIRVFLETKDITEDILLINLDPVLFGVNLKNENYSSQSSITYKIENTVIAKIQVELEDTIERLVIFKPIQTDIYNLSFFERFVVLPYILSQSRKSKFKFNKKSIKHLISWYLYPRKIYLVVVKDIDYLNIFPMDLHLHDLTNNHYSFALQPSNYSESILKKTKKIVVCELSIENMPQVYSLGKNHGETNLIDTSLPFKCRESQNFKYTIPDFCIGYKEVLIDNFKPKSTHTLFSGKVVFSSAKCLEEVQPFHVHNFFYENYIKKEISTNLK